MEAKKIGGTKRLMSLDVAKGLCIIGVVFMHAVISTMSKTISGNVGGKVIGFDTGLGFGPTMAILLMNFTYCLLMAFFIISGYVYKPGKGFKANMKKRLKQIVPVFIVASIAVTLALWGYNIVKGNEIATSDGLKAIFYSLVGVRSFRPYPGYYALGLLNATTPFYFLPVMLVAFVPFYLIADKTRQSLKLTVLAMVVLAGITALLVEFLPVHLPYVCEISFFAAAFMVLGAYLANIDFLGRIENNYRNARYWLIFVVVLILAIVASMYIPMQNKFMEGRFGPYGGLSVMIALIQPVLCSYVFFVVCAFIGKVKGLNRLLSFIGEHTLSILVLHYFFLKFLLGLAHPLTTSIKYGSVPEGVLCMCIAIALSILVEYAVRYVLKALRSKKNGKDPKEKEEAPAAGPEAKAADKPAARKGRLESLDIAKGLCIIGVVIGHMLTSNFTAAGSVGSALAGGGGFNPIGAVVQMGTALLFIFFFISGYVYKPGRGFNKNVMKRVKQIIPAIIVCSLVLTTAMWGYAIAMGYDISASEYLHDLWRTMIGSNTFMMKGESAGLGILSIGPQFYFLFLILVGCIIFFAIADKARDDLKITVVSAVVLAGISGILLEFLPFHLPFSCEMAPLAAAFMILGSYAAGRDLVGHLERDFKKAWYWPMFIVMFIAGFVSAGFIPTFGLAGGSAGSLGGLTTLLCFIPALTCGYAFLVLCAMFSKVSGLKKVLCACGAESLAILMLHFFFAKVISGFFFELEGSWIPAMGIVQGLAIGAVTIVLCIISSKIVARIMGRIKEGRKPSAQ